MKRTLIYFLLPACLVAAGASAAGGKTPTQLEAIDAELQLLEKEAHQLRLKYMKEEVSGQTLMFEQWGKYADQMKAAEEYEEEADRIQQRIDVLLDKRQQLQSSEAPPR